MKLIPDWFNSIRSVVTLLISVTFCFMAVKGRVEPKDFLLIVSLVFNFYFLAKKREDKPDA